MSHGGGLDLGVGRAGGAGGWPPACRFRRHGTMGDTVTVGLPPRWTWANLPPFHDSGIVPLLNTCQRAGPTTT